MTATTTRAEGASGTSAYRICTHAHTAELEEWCESLGYLSRATLAREAYDAVAPALEQAIRYQREWATGKRGSWRRPIKLSRHEGKEALLLFWGAEVAKPEQLPAAVANWRGLAPEERWWLVTQADATRGHPSYHPERGWRAALGNSQGCHGRGTPLDVSRHTRATFWRECGARRKYMERSI